MRHAVALPARGIVLDAYLDQVERSLIQQALDRSKSTAAAARLLGLGRTTLIERLRRLGSDVAEPRPRQRRSS